LIEPAHAVLQLALADGRGPNNKSAILNGFGHGLELLGTASSGAAPTAERASRKAS